MRAYSPRFNQALALAARAHREQLRKGSDTPYIQHPVCVAFILQRHGFPEELIIAALLHDVVEDCAVALADLEHRFGAEVARLVAAVSEQKTEVVDREGRSGPAVVDREGRSGPAVVAREGRSGPAVVERPWRTRKEEALHHLDAADAAVAALKAADALHNCQSTLEDLELHGPAAWGRFKTGAEEQRWYYRGIAERVRKKLGEHPLCDELDEAVAGL